MNVNQANALLRQHAPNGIFPPSFDVNTARDICQSSTLPHALETLERFVASVKPAATDGAKQKWRVLDPNTLSEEARMAHEDFRAANVAAAKSRKAFEDIALPEVKAQIEAATGRPLPDGKAVIVNYRWGKINVTVGTPRTTNGAADDLGDLY